MKKYIYTAVILVGFVLTTSCEDFLTTDNKSNVTDKEYFSTKTGFESLVSNAYSTLRDVYAVSSYTTYFNAGTDMYADGRNYINDELHYQNFYEFPKFRIKLLILILLHFNIVQIIY